MEPTATSNAELMPWCRGTMGSRKLHLELIKLQLYVNEVAVLNVAPGSIRYDLSE